MNASRRKWLFALITIVILAAAIFIFINRSRSTVEKYKAEARARGEKLTYAELVPHPQTDEEQYKRFTNAILKLQSAQITPAVWNLLKPAEPGRIAVLWKSETLPEDTSMTYQNGVAVRVKEGPETRTWRDFADVVRPFSQPIKELREILGHPAPNMHGDHDLLLNAPKSGFAQRRNAAYWFSGLVLLSLHYGKLDEAVADIQMIMGAQRLYQNDPTLINQMIRVAISGIALSTTWQALQADGWNEAQLAKLQHEFESYDTRPMMELAFIDERNRHVRLYELLSKTNNFRQLARMAPISQTPQPPKSPGEKLGDFMLDRGLLPLWRGLYGNRDFLFGQRWHQCQVDRWRRAQKNESWVKLRNEVQPIEREFQIMMTNRVEQLKHLLSFVAVPNFDRANTMAIRHEVLRELVVTAIALKRYEVRHGKPAPDLQALVPEFFPRVPLDAMDGKPIKYKLNADGTFTLYSAGDDGEDDGGDTKYAPGISGLGWDEIFNAEDAVWPLPATSNAAKK